MRKIQPKTDEYAIGGPHGIGKKEKAKPVYPTVRMDLKHVPEAKDMKVGDHAHIKMHAKLVGINQSRFDNSAEYEIHAIEHKKMKNKLESEDEAMGHEQSDTDQKD
jgi:hypothetical protein